MNRFTTLISSVVALTLVLAAVPAQAHGRDDDRDDDRPGHCSRSRRHRAPQQVIEEHIAAIYANDWAKAACDYAEDATVITDFGTFHGRTEVVAAKQSFLSAFGVLPVVTRITAEGPVVFLNYTLTSNPVAIPDGVDTYVIENGQIKYQTAHGLVVFGG